MTQNNIKFKDGNEKENTLSSISMDILQPFREEIQKFYHARIYDCLFDISGTDMMWQWRLYNASHSSTILLLPSTSGQLLNKDNKTIRKTTNKKTNLIPKKIILFHSILVDQ